MSEDLLFGLFVEIFHRFARALLVHRKIVIGAVGDTFEFLNAEGKFVFDIVSFLRVESAIFIRDVHDMETLAGDPYLLVKLQSRFEPLISETETILGAAEILDLHLLELARAEGVVPRIDLIAETFPDLGDPEGQLHPGSLENVLKLHKNRLRRLGAEVSDAALI